MNLVFIFFVTLSAILTQLSAKETEYSLPQVELQFENEEMKILKMTLSPGQIVPMHRDDNYRVIVVLKGGKLEIIQKTGEHSFFELETGKSYYLEPDPPGALHSTANKSKNPIEIVVILFKEAAL